MADEGSIDLLSGGFTRGQLSGLEQKMVLQVFSKYVASVDGMVNDGKEATVYLCRGHHPDEFLAAKVYRDRRFRAFANDAHYTDPGRIGDRRLAKAIKKRSKVGRRASHHLWIDREWQALRTLYQAGASVPRPVDHAPNAVLMELVGSGGVAAPMLAHVRLGPSEAERVLKAVMDDVETMLACELVHGDLSAYNILYHDGCPRLIDLPQSVDLNDAVDGWSLFYRDIENITGYFEKQGLKVETLDVAMKLWHRYS